MPTVFLFIVFSAQQREYNDRYDHYAYDGKNKNATTIGDGTFIGSDTMLVAPVNIGSRCTVGAGSTITRDVPDGALAVERSEQTVKPGWRPKWDRA